MTTVRYDEGMVTKRKCSRCRNAYPQTEEHFHVCHRDTSKCRQNCPPNKLQYYCKNCIRKLNREAYAKRKPYFQQKRKEWYADPVNRAGVRARDVLRKYGITADELAKMLEAQKGKCAICRIKFGKKTPHVDHDHDTGEVRGLLCDLCNRGLGMFQDSTAILASAQKYLSR